MIQFKTKRLIIREHLEKDLPGYHALMSDEINMKFLDDLQSHSPGQSKENLAEAIRQTGLGKDRTKYFFGIFCDETYIGEIGFTVLSSNPGKTEHVVELGYFINKESWGKGYTSEAAEAVIRFAFEKAGVVKIETGCAAENIHSEKIMKKNGFKKEAFKPIIRIPPGRATGPR